MGEMRCNNWEYQNSHKEFCLRNKKNLMNRFSWKASTGVGLEEDLRTYLEELLRGKKFEVRTGLILKKEVVLEGWLNVLSIQLTKNISSIGLKSFRSDVSSINARTWDSSCHTNTLCPTNLLSNIFSECPLLMLFSHFLFVHQVGSHTCRMSFSGLPQTTR